MKDCSNSIACLMQGFSNALGESNSSSVWNSAILFCTSSLKRLRPKMGYSWGDGERRLLLHGSKQGGKTKKTENVTNLNLKPRRKIKYNSIQLYQEERYAIVYNWNQNKVVTVHQCSKVSAERNPSQRNPYPQSWHSKQQHVHIYPLNFIK